MKPKTSYLVSAIVSVYNCERFLRGCLEDLEDQTMADKTEIIIVNTGSEQNERAIVREFQNHYDNIVYIETDKRETLYKAWNIGIKAASGKYITNANSDDRHRADAFEILSSYLEHHPDIDVVYAGHLVTEIENERFETCTPVGYYHPPEYSREKLLFHCLPSNQPMWRKTIHDIFGYFNELFEAAGDYEFWLRISKQCQFKQIDEYLGLYLNRPDSATNRELAVSVFESGYILNHYIDHVYVPERRRLNHNSINAIKNIRWQQSKKAFNRADFYFSRGLIRNAKKELRASIRYNWMEWRSYQLFVFCCLPSSVVRFLRRIKQKCFLSAS